MIGSVRKRPDDQFHGALDELERCAETPFIPGELERWHAAVSESLQRFTPLWKEHAHKVHPAEFQNITEEDPELLQRVELLREEDREIECEAERLLEDAARLQPAVQRVEPDEARVETTLTRFANAMLGFVIRVRKQEIAVRTWLVEAFGRDRGTVD